MNYWLHSEAEKELGEAAEYYLRGVSPQIAAAFVKDNVRTLDLVIENPRALHRVQVGQRVIACIDPWPWSLISPRANSSNSVLWHEASEGNVVDSGSAVAARGVRLKHAYVMDFSD